MAAIPENNSFPGRFKGYDIVNRFNALGSNQSVPVVRFF